MKTTSILLPIFLILFSLLIPSNIVIAAPIPIASPEKWDIDIPVLGSIAVDPAQMLSKSEPYIFGVTDALISYQKPQDWSKEPNRLLEHRKNTQSHVDQNGVPWARPPPEKVDMEAVLDERYYIRYEKMYQEGMIMVEEDTNGKRKLVYTNVFEHEGNDPQKPFKRKALDVGFNTDMLSLLGKDNGLRKDASGKTVYEKYLAGEMDVTQQSVFGNPIQKEYSDDEAVKLRYKLPPTGRKAQ